MPNVFETIKNLFVCCFKTNKNNKKDNNRQAKYKVNEIPPYYYEYQKPRTKMLSDEEIFRINFRKLDRWEKEVVLRNLKYYHNDNNPDIDMYIKKFNQERFDKRNHAINKSEVLKNEKLNEESLEFMTSMAALERLNEKKSQDRQIIETLERFKKQQSFDKKINYSNKLSSNLQQYIERENISQQKNPIIRNCDSNVKHVSFGR